MAIGKIVLYSAAAAPLVSDLAGGRAGGWDCAAAGGSTVLGRMAWRCFGVGSADFVSDDAGAANSHRERHTQSVSFLHLGNDSLCLFALPDLAALSRIGDRRQFSNPVAAVAGNRLVDFQLRRSPFSATQITSLAKSSRRMKRSPFHPLEGKQFAALDVELMLSPSDDRFCDRPW